MDVNEAFQSTFKIIFGECNVEMDELKEYLWKYHWPLDKRTSSISGKDTFLSDWRYCKDAKVISQDEIDFKKKFEPLNVNEMKDIDSIIEALKDRIYYTGNKIFGTSQLIKNSDNCVDSYDVYNSHNVYACRQVGYCTYARDGCVCVFGTAYFRRSKYLIRCVLADMLTRCFETHSSLNSSDLFFCHSCFGCNHAMFSFNIRSKRYCIGNLELPKDKYSSIRKKLIDESREYIEKNKTFYSILDSLPPVTAKPPVSVKKTPPPENFNKIDESFRAASSVILGKDIGPLKEYEKFLGAYMLPVRRVKTLFGNEAWVSDIFFFKHVPAERIICAEEAEEIGKQHIDPEEMEGLNLKNILGKISPFAFFCADFREGTNINNIRVHNENNASDNYNISSAWYVKNSACNTMSLSSEFIFGSYRIIHSKFCIRCHNSVKLTRCFEVSDSNNCSDCYFCHNCENLTDCMFCFNTKSKRYAIGNVEVGRESYMKIKKLALDEITRKLEKDKYLKYDIYNIGCMGKA